MKYNKKIILSLVCISTLQSSNYTYSIWPFTDWPTPAGKVAVDTAVKGADLLAKDHLPIIKGIAQSVGENAGLASTTAIIAASTAAAPYVAGAVTAYYVTKAGTYVYYQYYPTPEQIAQAEEQKALAEQHKAHAEEHKIAATEAHEKLEALREAFMVKAAFRTCLKNNLNSERNAIGIPSACANALHAYAMAASGEQVDRDVETFKKYSSQGT